MIDVLAGLSLPLASRLAGLQFAKLLTARWGSEQGLQFLLALHERFGRKHRFSFPEERA
jgi:hypothetical protein